MTPQQIKDTAPLGATHYDTGYKYPRYFMQEQDNHVLYRWLFEYKTWTICLFNVDLKPL